MLPCLYTKHQLQATLHSLRLFGSGQGHRCILLHLRLLLQQAPGSVAPLKHSGARSTHGSQKAARAITEGALLALRRSSAGRVPCETRYRDLTPARSEGISETGRGLVDSDFKLPQNITWTLLAQSLTRANLSPRYHVCCLDRLNALFN